MPVHVAGTGRILRKGRSLPRPSNTSVTFGRAITLADGENTTRFAARIEREVAALADEATTDWYSARRRAHRTDSPSLTDPRPGSGVVPGRWATAAVAPAQPPEALAGDLDHGGW